MTVSTEAPGNALATIADKAGLPAGHASAILADFGPLMIQREDLFRVADGIVVTNATQKLVMDKARDARLALKRVRIEAEKLRKKHKEIYKRGGDAVDNIGHAVMDPIEAVEARLYEAEKFAERAEEKQKAELKVARTAILSPFGFDIDFYDLAEMSEAQFTQLHQSFIALKADAERKAQEAEAARIAAEKKRLEEEAKIREENLRLQREREEQERVHAEAMRKAEAERKEAERVAREERQAIEEAARKEREALELKAAEERRAAAEAALVARQKAREEWEAADAMRMKEREAREKLEAAERGRVAAEKKRVADEALAKKAAEKAPDNQKLLALAQQIRSIIVPKVKSEEAERVCRSVADGLDELAVMIEKHTRE